MIYEGENGSVNGYFKKKIIVSRPLGKGKSLETYKKESLRVLIEALREGNTCPFCGGACWRRSSRHAGQRRAEAGAEWSWWDCFERECAACSLQRVQGWRLNPWQGVPWTAA